jgi:hypothetical protein
MRREIKLNINGKETTACQGDTVLAALVAAGYKVLKKSQKLN